MSDPQNGKGDKVVQTHDHKKYSANYEKAYGPAKVVGDPNAKKRKFVGGY